MKIEIYELKEIITDWMVEYHKYTKVAQDSLETEEKNYYYCVAGMYHSCAVTLHNKLVESGDIKPMKVIMECTG